MPPTILITAPTLGARGVEKLREAGCRVIFTEGREDELERLMASERPDAVISRTLTLSAAAMRSCPTLRVIVKHGAGVNNVDVDGATALGIPVLFTPAVNAQAVAELTFGLMLAVARGIVSRDQGIRAGAWPRAGDGFELSGRLLGIVGVGEIGRKVARIAEAFGMRVRGYDPMVSNSPVELADDLDALVAQADVLSLHCPLNSHTRGLFGSARLALLQPSAVLINTARGELVDENALADALATGRLRGAGLDSFASEPLSPDSPLRRLNNLVLSPHIGGATVEALEAVAERAATAVLAFLRGERIDPSICVNPSTLGQAETPMPASA